MWDSLAGEETVSGQSVLQWLADRGIKELGITDSEPRLGSFADHVKSVEHDFWQSRFRVYGQWKKDWYDAYCRRGYITLKTGFVCSGVMRKNEVINYPIQGSAFHCLLWSLNQLVMRELKRSKLKARVVGQIHDSIFSDVPNGEIEAYKELVLDVMINKYSLMSSGNYAGVLILNSPLPSSIWTQVCAGTPPLDPSDLDGVKAVNPPCP